MKTEKTKEWVTPELKVITELDVHENVLALSGEPFDPNAPPK